jgi:hypothetical protein
MKITNANDLLFAIAFRARVLCSFPSEEVRRLHGTADSKTAAIDETRGMSKAEVIEAILIDEFEDDANKIDEGDNHT